jgi:sugar phosphate isomerase/epimerase
MTVCCIASFVFKCPVLSDINCQLESLRRALNVANLVNCRIVRVFSFWRQRGCNPADSKIVSAFAAAAQIAEQHGLQLVIENGRRTSHCTARELLELIPYIDGRRIGVLWDPANAIYGGIEADPLADPFCRLVPHILHVHVKDPFYRSETDRRYCEFGNGQLNLAKLVQTLHDFGYRRYVSVETHWRPNRVFNPSELDVPGGDAFSADGLEATRRSIRYMKQLL